MSQPPSPSLMKAQFIRAERGRDADVGGERQGKTAAGGRALHQREDRLRAAPHQHHDVGDPALRIQGLGDAGRLLLAGAARHRMLEIEPGAERLSGALQHHHARGAVALQALEIVVERVDHGRDRAH